MAKVNQAQEPSMEEILASIRRIIADDEPASTEAAETGKPAYDESEAGADSAEEIGIAMPALASLPQEPDRLRTAHDVPVMPFQSRLPGPITAPVQQSKPPIPAPQAPIPQASPPQGARMPEEMRDGGALLSANSDAIVQSAFGNLANTILAGNQRTLEDLVKDMLRPMLKAWLDTNLPPLVEKLVRDEIERVSRGR
jgi:cell pole-organizing protein PopZ